METFKLSKYQEKIINFFNEHPQENMMIQALAGCVDFKTEFFNGKQWKSIADYQNGETVLQYNQDGSVELVIPEQFHKYPCKDLWIFSTKNGLNQCLSNEHNVYFKEQGKEDTPELSHITFKELKMVHENSKNGFTGKFITTFKYNGKGIDLTDGEIKLMCAIVCEGTYIFSSEEQHQGYNHCHFHIKKQKEKNKLKEIFNECGIKWEEQHSIIKGFTDFNIKVFKYKKSFTDYWYNCNQHQLQIVCDNILFWSENEFETHLGKVENRFVTSSKETVDFVQFAFTACGKRSYIEKTKLGYSLIIVNEQSPYIGITQKTKITTHKAVIYPYKTIDGFKYCFTTSSGMWVMRRKGKICVTGNSAKTFTITQLTKNTTTSDVYLAFNNAIAEECRGKITNPKTKIYTTYALGLAIMNYNLAPNKSGLGQTRNSENEKAQLDNLKIYKIVDEMITTAYGRRFDWEERNFLKNNYVNLYSKVRLGNYVNKREKIEEVVENHGLFVDLENGFSRPNNSTICSWIWEIDEKSLEQFEKEHIIDFTDMLYITIKYIKEGKWKVAPWQYFTNIYLDECIPGKQYIKTEDSPKAIQISSLYKKFQNNEKLPRGKSFNLNTKEFEYKEILNVWYRGKKPTLEITTEGLNKIRSTHFHPFLTQRGYVYAEELIPNKDCLILDTPNNQKTKYVLNEDQLQIVLASSISNGHLNKQNKLGTYRLELPQEDKQYNYFIFKKEMLNCSYENKIFSGYIQKRNVNTTISKTFCLFDEVWNLMEQLDERFLAIWYQDDGSISKDDSYYFRIHCNNLNQEQTEKLCEIIKRKFDIDLVACTTIRNGKSYWQIKADIKNTEKFLKLIAPFMNEDCAYKNPYFNKDNLYKWNPDFLQCGANFVTSIKEYKEEDVYDIEIADNHNFVCSTFKSSKGKKEHSGIVVKNCQDFNALQFELVKLIKRKNGRYIWTGDEHQAIYFFNNAEPHCFRYIRNYFKPITEFELPINYRCPVSHLKYVNEKFGIPIQPRPNAPEGTIKTIEKNEIIKYVKPGDMIISRKNKWLASLLLELASNSIPVYIEDKEMVESIKKLIKAQKVTGCSGLKYKFDETIKDYQKKINSIMGEITNPTEKEENEGQSLDINEASTKIANFSMKMDNINFIFKLLNPYMEKNKNALCENFLRYIDTILNTTPSNDCVRICSVHKAKGLEANNVFVLNEAKVCSDFRMSLEQKEQEVNLAYISVTRAIDTLYLVHEEDA